MKASKIFSPNKISNDQKASLKTRLISAFVAIAIALPCVLLGDIFFAVFVAVVVSCILIEIIRCSGQRHAVFVYFFCFVFAFSLSYFPMYGNVANWDAWTIFSGFKIVYIPALIIALSFIILFFVVVIDKTLSVRDACFIFTCTLLVSVACQGLLFLRYLPSNLYRLNEANPTLPRFNSFDNLESSTLCLYILLSGIFADTGAYFFGILFGHKKINERISEKKTWAGFFGGIFTSAILTMIYAFVLAACGHPVGTFLTLDNWYHIVILSISLPIISTLGDFVFSSIKRFYGIKDFSNIIPGHGGILDRVDSTVFTCLFASIYISMFFPALPNVTGVLIP